MGIVNYSYNRSTSGGEIIRELVNSTDGQGIHFANGAALLLAYASGGVFGTTDFSIEFILDQDSDNSSDNEIYTSQISGSNVLKVTNSISSNVVRISFDSTNYDIAYDMSGDYGTPTHYVLTCDRSALATLYKNGNSVGTIDISGSSAVNLGSGNTANGYLGGVSGYGVIGTYYRWRTWKKLLSSAEVTACYENASVPIADQWSNCVTDLDLAFANPERSLAVRSKSGVGDATASVGCFQLNPIEQLNSKSARIGTSAPTTEPADGDLLVSGNVGIGGAPTIPLDVFSGLIAMKVGADSTGGATRTNSTAKSARIGIPHYTNAEEPVAMAYLHSSNTENILNIGGGTGYLNAATTISFHTAANNTTTTGTTRLSIDSAGLATFSNGIAFQSATTGSGTGTGYTLDKYEVGTWSPTQGAAITVNSGSYACEGYYCRIGDVVHVSMRQTSGNIDISAGVFAASLPFTVDTNKGFSGTYTNGGPSTGGIILPWVTSLYCDTTDLPAAGQTSFRASATYRV